MPSIFLKDEAVTKAPAVVGFEAARLGRIHTPRRADIWRAEMALFLVDEAAPVELAMVVAGSPQDRHFIHAWDRLAHSSDLRHRYNQLKLEPGDDYDTCKAAFFVELAEA